MTDLRQGDRVFFYGIAQKDRIGATERHDSGYVYGSEHKVVWRRNPGLHKRYGMFLGWTTLRNGHYRDTYDGDGYNREFTQDGPGVRCAVIQPLPVDGSRYYRPIYVFEGDLERTES